MEKIANLIADIDPAAAWAFRKYVFHRETLILALMKGCQGTRFEDVSFGIWAIFKKMKALENVHTEAA